MEPTAIHQTIAQQIDHMKPTDLKPGVDVGMEVTGPLSVKVLVVPTGVTAVVTYNEGSDLYDVAVCDHEESRIHNGVFCDQLGELIFGPSSKPWTQGFGYLEAPTTDDGSGWAVIASW